jgi:hypothetical protein
LSGNRAFRSHADRDVLRRDGLDLASISVAETGKPGDQTITHVQLLETAAVAHDEIDQPQISKKAGTRRANCAGATERIRMLTNENCYGSTCQACEIHGCA